MFSEGCSISTHEKAQFSVPPNVLCNNTNKRKNFFPQALKKWNELVALLEMNSQYQYITMNGGQTPSTLAVILNNTYLLRHLYSLNSSYLSSINKIGMTAATLAAHQGSIEMIQSLWGLDPKLLTKTITLRNAATQAVLSNQTNVLVLLHSLNKHLLSTPDATDVTPAIAAIQEGNLYALTQIHRIMPALFSSLATYSSHHILTALKYKQLSITQWLIKKRPEHIFQLDKKGNSLAIIALIHKHKQLLAYL